jgi:glutaminyl-tRNA synthetase
MDDDECQLFGLRRRGYTAAPFVSFVISLVAKRENVIDVSLLEFCLREDLKKQHQE